MSALPALSELAEAEQLAADLRRSVTLARLQSWLADPRTQPGARLIYAVGDNATDAAAPGVAAWLRTLVTPGYVALFCRVRRQRPPGFQHEYEVRRMERRWLAGNAAELALRAEGRGK